MQRIIILLIAMTIIHVSCNDKKEKKSTVNFETDDISQLVLADGFKLLENNCFSCHSPDVSSESKIAPALGNIKKHYLSGNSSEEKFITDLIRFLKNPKKENSRMPDAIEQYGIMPKMEYSDSEIMKMGKYIYHTPLEKQDWYENNYSYEKAKYDSSAEKELAPIEKGQIIAKKTKSVLGKNLIKAINTKGTEHALSFCSTRAIPLTDSMAATLNASVKRVSDKVRNPDNKANSRELSYIKKAKESISEGQAIKPQLITSENTYVGYYPILTNEFCLQCHGRPEQNISKLSLRKIDDLYPNDKAINYSSGELRGIWVIEFDK